MTYARYNHHSGNDQPRSSLANWVLIGFIAIVAFFLIVEHRAHLFDYLPFVLLLACPLMHLFMHRGHGGHGDEPSDAGTGKGDDKAERDRGQ